MIRVNNDKRNVGVAGTGEGSEKHGYSENEASGNYSTVENGGPYTGSGSHVNYATGNFSHAEGSGSHAEGENAHAEGSYGYASGESSHAEGFANKANGEASHAEGYNTLARGNYSHAEGKGTVVYTEGGTVVGKYNTPTDALFQVGTGSSDDKRATGFAVLPWGGTAINGEALITKNASINGNMILKGSIINSEYYTMYSTLIDNNKIPVVQWNIGTYSKSSSPSSPKVCTPQNTPQNILAVSHSSSNFILDMNTLTEDNSVIASLYNDGTLYISGNGEISPEYFRYNTPWEDYKENITKCIIDTSVYVRSMDYWFRGCINLREISYIPITVVSMNSTFCECISLVSCPTIPTEVNILAYTFTRCNSLAGSIDIEGNPKFFDGCFAEAALSDTLTINYTDSFTGIDDIINTKSVDSNIVKGTTHTQYIAKWNIGANDSNTLYNGHNGLDTVIATLYSSGKLEIDGTGNTVLFHTPNTITCSTRNTPIGEKVFLALDEVNDTPMASFFGDAPNVPWLLCYGAITEYEIKITVTPKNMDYWFMRTNITTAIIPNGVISLNGTFDECGLLSNISTIPNSVLYMNGTFIGCSSLKTAPVLPEKLRTMGGCFQDSGITTMPNIPKNINNLSYTFNNCTSLVNIIDIPDNILYCFSTFSGCTSLVNPPQLSKNTIFADYTFENCSSLTKAPIIPRKCTDIEAIFENCSALTGELIIQGVPTRYTSAFSGTSTNTGTNLTVNYIDKFSRIDRLISTKSSNSNITQGNYIRGTWNVGAATNNTVYDGTNGTNSVVATLQYDNNLYITGNGNIVVFTYTDNKSNAPWCDDAHINFVESYTIETNVKYINMDYWFTNCSNLFSIIDIPKEVVSLNSTFMNCVNLTGKSKIWGNPTAYTNCFNGAATNNSFILDYMDASTNIDNIIATKSNNSKITKGTNIIGSWNIGVYFYNIGYSEEGNNSPSVKAVLKNDGTLVISGYGAITLFGWNDTTNRATTPWTQIPYCDYVRALQIEDSLVINNMDYWFQYCSNMSTPPAIPSTVTSMKGTFMNSGITEISNIPSKVTTLESAFENCKKLTGTGIINGNPATYIDCFKGAATDDGTALVINYASSCTNIDKIIATKDATSHITKGTTV